LGMAYVSAAYESGAVRKMRGTPCQCVRCEFTLMKPLVARV